MQAIVIGATGLVGGELVRQLLDDTRFTSILVFVRRPLESTLPGCTVHVIDFNKPDAWKQNVKGDVLFSCMGTTLKTAGSKTAQYTVDFTYQYRFAQIASENKVETYVLVSSAGASDKSLVFYSKMKGELECAIKKLPFAKIRIMQPGILDGDRKEHRPAEKMAISVMRLISRLPGLGKNKPIHCSIVAKAMINSVFLAEQGSVTVPPGKMFDLGR
jgi:uncharacterized protein YbjT (DUF2867 family)